jgi:hypothetical protein
MSGSTARSPRLRDIFLGIAALGALIVVFINLGVVVKFIGTGFLVIPSALGIVQVPGPKDIATYDLSSSPTPIGISQPGRYALYAYDFDLLMVSDQLEQTGAAPWITLKSQITGEAVPVSWVTRGLRPYDTHLAKGRPVMTFVITQPGIYLMYHSTRNSTISIVRDYVTGKERTLALVMWLQIAVIVVPLAFLFVWRHVARADTRRAAQREKRERSEAFWRDQAQRNQTWRRPK